jgi:hypothetical protein
VKSQSKTLIWGTTIALGIIGFEWVWTTRFSGADIHLSDESIRFGLVTVTLAAILIAAYRRLLRKLGYWLLLGALLCAHVCIYLVVASSLFRGLGPIRADATFGIIAGVEFVAFALMIAKIYGVGPNIRWLSSR